MLITNLMQRRTQGGGGAEGEGGGGRYYILQSLAFFVINLKNYKLCYSKLQVELIINNAPLTYVNPNTIKIKYKLSKN